MAQHSLQRAQDEESKGPKRTQMPKEMKTSMELAQLVQAETVRLGMSCDVMISPDRHAGCTATALVPPPSRAADVQRALDLIANELREKYELKHS
jgi:hypothetical protein